MILDNFWIIYKTNDPQIFHLQKKLWGLQIIHEARRMLFDYLVEYTHRINDLLFITLSHASRAGCVAQLAGGGACGGGGGGVFPIGWTVKVMSLDRDI